ncbi:hypothetical protein H5410_060834 [Solanum commersonii]|uniref:Uncharacterized protein n=1 Tax=Solanum commersonii TaxID=4109 RepID=A0A9J5W772_SOLCO|nr:hypothetical protein H5410_060834 [Solanum commersonii]
MILDGVCEVPWLISFHVREGNKHADFFTNLTFSFAGTITVRQFHKLQDLPRHAKAILLLQKHKCPNLRITKYQKRISNHGVAVND